jgi:mxaJ protein
MSFRCKPCKWNERRGLVGSSSLAVLITAFLLSIGAQGAESTRVLRIAADPNNLPFSNENLEGFENKIAEIIAQELNVKLEYRWHAQRRGFFRETLKNGDCDLVLGVPIGSEKALTTKPYYTSSYVFVRRRDCAVKVNSLDDPALRSLRIGVQLVGADGANTPPVDALSERGMITNIVGFTVYGDYREKNPAARIVDAVAKREVDTAIVWGPLAGYFAQMEPASLEVVPLGSALPFTFKIGMGVRKNDAQLRDRLNEVLSLKAAAITKILKDYGIPTIDLPKDGEQKRAEGKRGGSY